MNRKLGLIYGMLCYLAFIASYSYFVLFVGNLVVPKSIDAGTAAPVFEALFINLLLITLFALQHSVMARQGFKQWWTKIVPKSLERSTYVLLSGILLTLLIWQWRPLPAAIWRVENEVGRTVLYGLYGLGFIIALTSSFLINHFELFGLQQVYQKLHQKSLTTPHFQVPFLYKFVRHPLQAGQLLIFWATPEMTVGHLVLALGMTAYMLIGIYFEERDLVRQFGERYLVYREQVSKLIPLPAGKTAMMGAKAKLSLEEL